MKDLESSTKECNAVPIGTGLAALGRAEGQQATWKQGGHRDAPSPPQAPAPRGVLSRWGPSWALCRVEWEAALQKPSPR